MGERKVEPLHLDQVAEAALVLSRAYSPSPLIVAALGEPSEKQRRGFGEGLKGMLPKMPGETYVAKEDGKIVGVMRIVEWPDCQRSPLQGLYLVPALLFLRGKAIRWRRWQAVWKEHDPKEPHWHLAMLGVLPEKQGQGIGSLLLGHFCERVDRLKQAAYLETDKSRNVRLYERFGFSVVEEAPVLSVPNWFMWRPPRSE